MKKFMETDLLPEGMAYKLLVGAIVPRPIAWVSTLRDDGTLNLAPFSFFTVASRTPPTLAVSVGESGRGGAPEKDTLAGARETGQLTVNIANRSLLDNLVETSGDYAPDINEFEVSGLTAIAGSRVATPLVAEAPINMECEVRQILPIGADHLILASVLAFHIDRRILDERYRIDHDGLAPIGRVAGPRFCVDMEIVQRDPPIAV